MAITNRFDQMGMYDPYNDQYMRSQQKYFEEKMRYMEQGMGYPSFQDQEAPKKTAPKKDNNNLLLLLED